MLRLCGRCATERVRIRTSARQSARPDALNRSARAALAWIERRVESELDRDYAHRMRFREVDGFSSGEDQAGSVFQRAVMGWTQNRCIAAGLTVKPRAAEQNLTALMSMRRTGEAGGWSYFPQLRELPPDADDLGQVCLACPPSRLGEVAPTIEQARDLLLQQHVHDHGGISTWLTDSNGPADLTSRYEWAIKTHWGRGADPEVTANVVYGLDAAGFGLPANVVQQAVSWVKQCQNKDGYWESTWYDGPYYGSYVCCRLIRANDPESPSLARAAEFMLQRQRGDGGWGDTASECLSTALASLALMETNAPGARDGARRGIEYLRLTQSDSGSWQSGRLIQMNVNRANPEAKAKMLYHGSPLLTTCFALAATAGMLAGRPD